MAGEASGDLNLSRGSNFGDDGRVTLKQDSETTKIPTMLPVKKRPLDIDNCNSSHSSAKKSKVSVCDDDDDDDDDDDHMPISCIVKMSSISADKPLSVMKKQQEGRSNERPLDTDNCNSSHSSAKKSKVSLCDDDDDDDMPISWRVKRSSISADKPLSVMKKQQEEEFVCPVKEESNLGSQENDIELRENRLKGQLEELKSKEKEFEGRVEELEFKVNQLKGQIKEFESKEERSVEQVKDLELRNKHSESLMEELKTREKKLEDRVEELELKEKKLEDRVKEFELKMKEFESQVKELKSDKRREKQNEVSLKSIEEENELDNQLSPTIDGRSLQLPPSERTDEPESLEYSILDVLKTASDPSKVVLDFIQKPIVPPCMKGDNAISHIFVLEQLMHISPHVKPHIREEAMRLAHDLKANIREISENSLVALCFLQLLSIFGLLSSFSEDEVLEIFEFAAHHKQTVDLFRTLGFADKVSDFVQGLIKKEKYFGAVRFICAFKLEDKNQPVDLLRKYAQNAKLMTERICKNAKSLEIKDNARDQEIANLKSVQQCISDNSLESEDLSNEIQHRINELNWNKGTGVYNLRKRKASNGH